MSFEEAHGRTKNLYTSFKKYNTMLSLLDRLVILVVFIVTIVDVIGFYAIKDDPSRLTGPFVIEMIAATIMPMALCLWFWLGWKETKNDILEIQLPMQHVLRSPFLLKSIFSFFWTGALRTLDCELFFPWSLNKLEKRFWWIAYLLSKVFELS